MSPKRPTPPPLTKTERQALEDLIRRGARALNPAEGNRLLRLLELDQGDRQQERRTAGGLMAQVQQLGGQLKDMTADRDRLAAELAALHDGEEPYEDGRTVPTPAQFIWQWNRATPERRLEVAATWRWMADIVDRCTAGLHEARIAELGDLQKDWLAQRQQLAAAKADRDRLARELRTAEDELGQWRRGAALTRQQADVPPPEQPVTLQARLVTPVIWCDHCTRPRHPGYTCDEIGELAKVVQPVMARLYEQLVQQQEHLGAAFVAPEASAGGQP